MKLNLHVAANSLLRRLPALKFKPMPRSGFWLE
jgi:hypothetical protein